MTDGIAAGPDFERVPRHWKQAAIQEHIRNVIAVDIAINGELAAFEDRPSVVVKTLRPESDGAAFKVGRKSDAFGSQRAFRGQKSLPKRNAIGAGSTPERIEI